MTKDEYEFYKGLGICVNCLKEKAQKGYTRCLACRMAEREQEIARGRKKEYDKEKYKQKRLLRKQDGLCTKCGCRKAVKGLLCSRCYSYQVRYRKRNMKDISRSERVSHGLCYICGKESLMEGKRVCCSCYSKRMESMSKIMYLTKTEKKAESWC